VLLAPRSTRWIGSREHLGWRGTKEKRKTGPWLFTRRQHMYSKYAANPIMFGHIITGFKTSSCMHIELMRLVGNGDTCRCRLYVNVHAPRSEINVGCRLPLILIRGSIKFVLSHQYLFLIGGSSKHTTCQRLNFHLF
jgi:hypothetical protein